MGKYFVMSMRFNKCSAQDFGLILQNNGQTIDQNDGSIWIKTNLYDFGWGKENGYYKVPLPDFSKLLDLTLYSEDYEDMYGAASVILYKYPDELLNQCEIIMVDQKRKKELKKLIKLFNLSVPLNRSSTLQKTYAQIQDDAERWKKVSDLAKNLDVK